MAMSADVQVKSTNDEKLEYVYFLLCLSRFDLDMYWRHLKVWDGTVRIHSMFLSRAPGYCNFKVNFQEAVSTGFNCITSCSAEELYEDKRFARKFLPVFHQLLHTSS